MRFVSGCHEVQQTANSIMLSFHLIDCRTCQKRCKLSRHRCAPSNKLRQLRSSRTPTRRTLPLITYHMIHKANNTHMLYKCKSFVGHSLFLYSAITHFLQDNFGRLRARQTVSSCGVHTHSTVNGFWQPPLSHKPTCHPREQCDYRLRLQSRSVIKEAVLPRRTAAAKGLFGRSRWHVQRTQRNGHVAQCSLIFPRKTSTSSISHGGRG